MSFPRHLSDEQKAALPIGPYIEHMRPITAEDRANGKRGRFVMTIESPKVTFQTPKPDDPICWRDQNGDSWTFGQWESGAWFKQPVMW